MKEKIFESINTLRGSLTILLVDQDMQLALGVTDRAYVIENGKLIREGQARHLLEDVFIRKAYLGI